MASVSKSSLSCLQLNVQHKKEATSNLVQLMSELQIDIAFVQEPYTIRNNLAAIPSSLRIFASGNNRKRAALLVNNKRIDVILIKQLSDEDCVVAEVSYRNSKFYAISLYFDSNEDIKINIRKTERILDSLKGHGLIIGVDSNARSKTWYDVITNQRGKELEEFLTINNLHIVNEKSEPTFETMRGKSYIDLTITNNQLIRRVTEWTCGIQESCSDHKILTFKIEIQRETYRALIPDLTGTRYTIQKDLKKFDENLNVNLISKFNCENLEESIDKELHKKLKQYEDVDEVVDLSFSCITDACKTAFKVSRRAKWCIKQKTVPWWSDELTVLRKKTNALRRRYQRTISNEGLRQERRIKYLEGKREYERKIQEKKLKSWKMFCTTTDGTNPWGVVFKIAAGKLRTSTRLTTLKKEDGTYTTDMDNTMRHMLEYFIPDDNEESDSELHKRIRREVKEPIYTDEDTPFTTEELIAGLKKFDPDKAPGEDGLTSVILIRAFETFPLFFTELYNACLRNGCFPKIWKHSIIIPIVKPGKEECSDLSKYRPISLLNIGGKLLERVLIDRINFHIFSNDLINNNQYGFIPQKGTVDAVIQVKHFVEESLRQKQGTIITSLDVRGAFDAAWWPGILMNARDLKCPKNLYNLLMSYFNHRTATFSTQYHKLEKQVHKGCPQGSCCGPGLWNILYNSLLNMKFSNRTRVIAFADDLIVLTRGMYKTEAENYANADLKRIERWASDNKIQFNDEKSKVLFVSRKRNDDKVVNIYLNHRRLNQTEEMKYLGIYLDSHFNFNSHIQYTAEKSIALINKLAKTAKLQWGLGHKALKTIYEGAIVPILTYGAPVWVEAIRKRKNLTKFKRIHRMMNIKMGKAYRTVSYDASCIIAGVQPIEIKIEEIVGVYIATKVDNLQYDAPMEIKFWRHPAEVVIIQEVENNIRYPMEVYTDGSKTENNVGAAGIIFMNGKMTHQLKFKLHRECSNNQAEQIAILKILEKLEELTDLGNNEKRVAIYTDSRITLDLLKNKFKHNRLIELIRNEIHALTNTQWIIHFGWVKGHAGITGNELADRLAKEAALSVGEVVYDKIPKEVIVTKEKKKALDMWEQQWITTTKGAVTKSFFPSVTSRLRLNIHIFPELTIFLTGHGKLRTYCNRFGFSDNSMCVCNEEEQTVDHLIYHCGKLREQRNQMIRDIRNSGGAWPTTNDQIIKNHLKKFTKFIRSIDFSILGCE